MVIDEVLLAAILSFTGGAFTVTTAVQALKAWLKLTGAKAVILSAVLAYAFTAGCLLLTSAPFTLLIFGVYGAIVFAEVNGFYKYIKPILEIILQLLAKKEEEPA